jgi:zinc transport system substrate-binding protein
MKKHISVLLAAILMVSCLSACGLEGASKAVAGNKLKIVTTIFPEYDWVMNVLGDKADNAEVTMLLDNGVDLHSYQPTAEDILKISNCDIFIYVGGESDEWVEDALKEATNKNMYVIDLLDVLGDRVKEEEVVEGMQEEEHHHDGEDEDHDHEDGEEHDHEHEEGEEVEYDEHVWLSLKNASALTESISDALQAVDKDNAEAYKANADAYISKLNELDKKYQDAVSSASKTTLLFGDRFPFRYMVDDYGLSYYAAFVGCSAETEASFETISFLAGKVDELSLNSVMTIEGPDHRIAETIVQNTGSKDQKILSMDSMQSTTSKDVQSGTTYLGIMEDNLKVLEEALN